MRKPAVWALDFGEESVIALAAEEKDPGEWTLLGSGQARARGVKNGEIEKLTDAVESVVEALRMAERNARRRCVWLYYNFDDAGMESAHPRGAKTLVGEGQIGRPDVREAARNAIRLVGDFEKMPVYSREIDYVIDDKDLVGNPLGVFGHRLDVVLHVLLARSCHLERWKKLMRRAEVARAIPVPSLVSAFYGVLEKKAVPAGTQAPRQIVWDLGGDLVSGGVVEKSVLREYTVFLRGSLSWPDLGARMKALSRLWADEYNILEPLVLTGDLAGQPNSFQRLSEEIGLPAVSAAPTGFSTLTDPKYASVAGLLKVAMESQRARPGAKTQRDLVGQVRDKASALMQEYF